MNVPFLGELALNPEVRKGGDTGAPVTTRPGDDASAAPFYELAQRVDQLCNAATVSGPKITVED
jgi:hypothetical protein